MSGETSFWCAMPWSGDLFGSGFASAGRHVGFLIP